MRHLLLTLILAVPILFNAAAYATTVVTTPQVRAELLAHAPDGVAVGKPLWVGLQLQHQPHWHTYWKNPGDSGLPTTFEWSLPPGVVAGDIDWPAARALPFGPLVNYGYEGTVLLPVALTLPADFDASTVDLRLRADWLVCKESCIPESGEFTLSLPLGPAIGTHRAAFDSSLDARPRSLAGVESEARVVGGTLLTTVRGLPEGLVGRDAQFLPETEGLINHAAPIVQRWHEDAWEARIALSAQRSSSPALLSAVMLFDDRALRVQARVEGWDTPGTVAAPSAGAAVAALPDTAATGSAAHAVTGIGAALLLALFGGALLNLMPCVFPILSLKVLGFARHAGERRQLAIGGLAYGAGVVLSFLALAGALLGLRAAGAQLGWGFQLQEPGFIAALALLFTLIGLNLAGVFELRTVFPGSAAGWQLRHPAADAFLTGILAVAIASPCTAPFMGAALGFALTLPTTQTLLVFATLGTGLALPYLIASLVPSVARSLPRPGPWMARLRTLMAFPMFATVVWLLWVFGIQRGLDGVIGLLAVLVAVAFATWAWAQPGRSRRWLGLPALAVVVAAAAWSLPALRTGADPVSATGGVWAPWTAQAVSASTEAGRPVFVDFTAAWCVTCQLNKLTTLADPAVLADFDRADVTLLRADWTSRDPAISAELNRLGRGGVPVYALYPAADAPPQLLSELLTAGEIRSALATLKHKESP
ncbi:MAG: protein-disulfide reductase DsbD family protein [Azoarcus sp.]|nr:protein-disulfide reductase DsbD family protein [Azoarcus sp.]